MMKNVTHTLTPFNGMKSGFNPDGSTSGYYAQVTTLKGIVDFSTQNNADSPPLPFGYMQMVYYKSTVKDRIQIQFTSPNNIDSKVILIVKTNVSDSIFNFKINGVLQSIVADKIGINTLDVPFVSSANGVNSLIIDPEYGTDATTFLLLEIRIIV